MPLRIGLDAVKRTLRRWERGVETQGNTVHELIEAMDDATINEAMSLLPDELTTELGEIIDNRPPTKAEWERLEFVDRGEQRRGDHVRHPAPFQVRDRLDVLVLQRG